MNHCKIIALLPILALASCADDIAERDIAAGREISFSYSLEADVISRAGDGLLPPKEITLMSDNDSLKAYVTVEDIAPQAVVAGRGTPVENQSDISGFTAYSFFHPADASRPQVFFTDETVSATGSNLYATANKYFWPTGDGKLSFYALVGASESTKVTPVADASAAFDIEYSVPADATKQKDLLLATTLPVNTPGTPVGLRFKHLCSQVTFVVGKDMQQGTIKSITLSGINSHGVYSSEWTGIDTPASFTVNVNKSTSNNESAGTVITGGELSLMMIPQTLGSDARLTVVFDDAVSGAEHTLTASIAGDVWNQSKKTIYHIGITPRYELSLDSPVEVQDATYIICPSTIRVSNVADNVEWTVKIEATENPHSSMEPSVQLQSEANQFVKAGFWTDKNISNGDFSNPGGSARGESSFTGKGSGNFPVYIFLPENSSNAPRTYTFTIMLTGNQASAETCTITQLAPNWQEGIGWEQIDDKENGIFGFNYTSTKVFVYHNGEYEDAANTTIAQVQKIIDQYNAAKYARVERFVYRRIIRTQYRNFVEIDYRKLSNLGDNANSMSDGSQNTVQLFNYGGPAITQNFEAAIRSMRRRTDQSKPAYRERDPEGTPDSNDPTPENGGPPYAIDGDQITQTQILASALKKNRYYLNTSTEGDLTTTTALIDVDDIVWFIPACDQFATAPTWYDGTAMVPGEFWSSTAINSNNNDTAYDGAKAQTDRGASKRLRVARVAAP